MAIYQATKNLFLKTEDITVLDGGVVDLTEERAAAINHQEPGALVLTGKAVSEETEEEKPKRSRKKVDE